MATSKRKKKRTEDEDEEPSGETALFQDEVVTVTSTRAIIGGTTYALANITSVSEFIQPRPTALFLIGGVMFMIGALLMRSDQTTGLVCVLIGAAFLGLYFLVKPKHWVRIGTAGAETNAVYSVDPVWTAKVVEAINEAIISRG